MYQKPGGRTDLIPSENRAIDQLVSLLEESDTADLIDRIALPQVLSLSQEAIAGTTKDTPSGSKLKKKSSLFPPPSSNPNIAAFLWLVDGDIDKLHVNHPRITNISFSEKQALKFLSDNISVIIKPGDKGGNIVLMDNIQYVAMCSKIKKNKNWYRKIAPYIVQKFNLEYYQLVDQAYSNNIINKTTWEYIRMTFPKVPTFYSLPKVHKDVHNPTGRPIISGRGSISENASRLIDKHLKPHVACLQSYVKDQGHDPLP